LPAADKHLSKGILTSLKLSRQFRFLWVSNLFFFGGAWTQTLVLAWLVLETTGSTFRLALFTAVRLAPLLLGPFSGVISDRFDRVKLLLGACTWTLCAVSIVATVVTLDRAPYWVLVLGGLAIGLGQSPSQPSRSSLVLDLVSREHLSNANALNSMAMNVTQVVGPAAGGAMISTFGAPSALWISTAWYALSLCALLPLRSMKHSRQAHHESAIGMLVSGFRTVLSNRLTATVLCVTLCANILIWPVYQAFVPVFAVDVLGLDAAGLGWLLTCVGVGGLTGSLIIASLGDFRFKGGLFVLGTGAWGVLWALFGLSTSTPLSFVLMIGIGIMSASFGVLQTTLLLMTTDPAVQGRALGMQELAIGIMPISALILGGIADRVGVGPTTTVCGCLLAICMLTIAVRVPSLLRYG
jgi:MFS family permease